MPRESKNGIGHGKKENRFFLLAFSIKLSYQELIPNHDGQDSEMYEEIVQFPKCNRINN
jgi:hypothetical protein